MAAARCLVLMLAMTWVSSSQVPVIPLLWQADTSTVETVWPFKETWTTLMYAKGTYDSDGRATLQSQPGSKCQRLAYGYWPDQGYDMLYELDCFALFKRLPCCQREFAGVVPQTLAIDDKKSVSHSTETITTHFNETVTCDVWSWEEKVDWIFTTYKIYTRPCAACPGNITVYRSVQDQSTDYRGFIGIDSTEAPAFKKKFDFGLYPQCVKATIC